MTPLANLKRMPDARPTILITGFGPFPGVPRNASSDLSARVARRARSAFPGVNIVHETLATEWNVAPGRVMDLVHGLRPQLALHFGVSHRAPGFVIETIARNATGRIDAAGVLPESGLIDRQGPVQLATQLPAGRILSRLRRLRLPAVLSRDAGAYLCNAVFYTSVRMQARLDRGGQSGFIHLPSNLGGAGAGPLCMDRATAGGLEIIAACLGANFGTRPARTGPGASSVAPSGVPYGSDIRLTPLASE